MVFVLLQAPLRVVLTLMFQGHPHRLLASLRRILARSFHDPILSRNRVSGKVGSVQLVVDSDVRDYLTLLLTRLDPRARTLAYASAGHVTGYLLDRSGEIREELKSTGIPLGMFAEHAFPSGPTLSLEPDEIVVLFTDGVTEAGESHGGAFGADRLLDFIRSHRHDPASRIAEGLCQTAQSLQDDTPQTDDMTVVICKVEPHVTANGA